MKIETVTPSKAYDDGFAEGVDWATPHVWNEAIEAAADIIQHEAATISQLNAARRAGNLPGAIVMESEAARLHSHAAAIRKLKKGE